MGVAAFLFNPAIAAGRESTGFYAYFAVHKSQFY
jgi:hypothetical protein